MFRRLIILSIILFSGLAVFVALGLKSLDMHAKGLEAKRGGEFVEVAQQIRQDVKRKLDEFLQTEQQRPFSDYQHLYVPDNVYDNDALLVSPLADKISNGLAYGYFQIDSDGNINSPYADSEQSAPAEIKPYLNTIQTRLLPVLEGRPALQAHRIVPMAKSSEDEEYHDTIRSRWGREPKSIEAPAEEASVQKGAAPRRGTYPIKLEESQQPAQVLTQSRANVERNIITNTALRQASQEMPGMEGMGMQAQQQEDSGQSAYRYDGRAGERPQARQDQLSNRQESETETLVKDELQEYEADTSSMRQIPKPQSDTVQVRIEPFTPLIVPAGKSDSTMFNGQVFLLRHVQIEQNHFLQGFRLDQDELARQIRQSAQHLIRRGMEFDISLAESPQAAYTAVLDFGFGDLVLNLIETNPRWLVSQIALLRNIYFVITGIVVVAILLAMISLGRNLHAQLALSHKKDDFISAVSHELRTPLTSIRMYTEMLENDWVKSEEKRKEYYVGMRQESERLSRLIENVLDFSRIQRKKKKYNFLLGSLNETVQNAVNMFRPCAQQAGFTIQTELADLPEFAFDRDAIVQIVINLLDNAVKYAADGDKQIIIRTRRQKDHMLLEVEDRGPGIPRRLHKKVFEEFYRATDESTRETTGTGLGLALVRKFAQAHEGLVTIANAKPRGTVLRVTFRLAHGI